MASEITEKVFNIQGVIPVAFQFTKAAQSDWIVFGDYPGIIAMTAKLYTGADEATITFGTAAINNSGTAYTATSTSIVVASGTITRVPPYYVRTTSGEIIMVLSETAADNAASTWTIQRGCLGTTASATGLANSNTVYILNMLVFGANTTGTVTGMIWPLPSNPGAKLFYTDGS